MSDDFWTKARVARLVAMTAQGFSSTQVARKLGGGITRNAVLGKLYRLRKQGLPPKAGEPKPEPKPEPKAAKPKAAKLPRKQHKQSFGFGAAATPNPATPPTPVPLTDYDGIDPRTPGLLRIMDLKAHHCRWPLNNALGGEYYFCGDKRQGMKPYCEKHNAKAYTKVIKDQNDAAAKP